MLMEERDLDAVIAEQAHGCPCCALSLDELKRSEVA
jgi:hypothetical protein